MLLFCVAQSRAQVWKMSVIQEWDLFFVYDSGDTLESYYFAITNFDGALCAHNRWTRDYKWTYSEVIECFRYGSKIGDTFIQVRSRADGKLVFEEGDSSLDFKKFQEKALHRIRKNFALVENNWIIDTMRIEMSTPQVQKAFELAKSALEEINYEND